MLVPHHVLNDLQQAKMPAGSRPCWDPAPSHKQKSPFVNNPSTKYGRILTKMEYDYHYKWIAGSKAATDCRTGPEVLKQLAMNAQSQRWKPSKNNQHIKAVQDRVLDKLIRKAKPAVDNRVSASALHYSAYRKANKTGGPSIVERYVQKKAVHHHKEMLRKMTASVDTSAPEAAMHYHYHCLRQPYTRTGVLKRPKTQQSKRKSAMLALSELKASLVQDVPDSVQLPERRPTTAPVSEIASREQMWSRGSSNRPMSRGMLDDMNSFRNNMSSAGSMGSAGVHLPISAARDALEGHVMIGDEDYYEDDFDNGTSNHHYGKASQVDTTMREMQWPPACPTVEEEGDDNTPEGTAAGSAGKENRAQSPISTATVNSPVQFAGLRSGPSKAALVAHRAWLATANWRSDSRASSRQSTRQDDSWEKNLNLDAEAGIKAAESAATAAAAAKAAAEQESSVNEEIIEEVTEETSSA